MDEGLMPLAPGAGCPISEGRHSLQPCHCVGCLADRLLGCDGTSHLERLSGESFLLRGLVDPDCVIGWGDIEQLIDAPGVRANLNRNSRRIHQVNPGLIGPGLADGETLQIQDSERACLRLGLLCAELQRRIGEGPVGCNIYLSTRTGRPGLQPHRDQIDAIIVQLVGRKEWTIWDPEGIPPDHILRETFWAVPPDGGRVALAKVLEPGDVLFVKRGAPHRAVCATGPSLHLTVGVHRLNTQDILNILATEAEHCGALCRSADRLRGGESAPGRVAWLTTQLEAIQAWIAQVDPMALSVAVGRLSRSRFDDRGQPSAAPHIKGQWPALRLLSGAGRIDPADLVLASPALSTARLVGSTMALHDEDPTKLTAKERDLLSFILHLGGRPIRVAGMAERLQWSQQHTISLLEKAERGWPGRCAEAGGSMSFLELRGVSKRYGSAEALRSVDLSLEPGQVLGLLGRNGAGKTTMLSIVAGILRPDSGSVTLAGFDSQRSRARFLAQVGYVPQDLSVYPTLTVRANLRFFAELRGLSGSVASSEIERVAGRLILSHLLKRKAGTLSGGEQRRLHSAIGLLGRPSCILLDEPTVGADGETRAELMDEVRRLAAEGATVIYTSHYTPEIEQICDRVAILDAGLVRTMGSVDDVVSRVSGSYLELTFRHEVPPCLGVAEHSGQTVRMPCIDPATELVDLIRLLGSAAEGITSVEIVRPSLESAYLSLTGTKLSEAIR